MYAEAIAAFQQSIKKGRDNTSDWKLWVTPNSIPYSRTTLPTPHAARRSPALKDYGIKRLRYSLDRMKAFTISALTKLPLNAFSLFSQNS